MLKDVIFVTMKKLIFIVVAVIIVQACKKDSTSATLSYKPTPYNLQYPSFLANDPLPLIPIDNPLTEEGIALGRKLFYENMLSNNMSMNCATCHKQTNAFSDPRQFSLGANNAVGTRNAMSLVNLAWSNKFFWDGRRTSLETQAHDPVTNPVEMENTWPVVVQRLQASSLYPDLFYKAFGTKIIDSILVTKAIAQFERILTSYNSRFDKFSYQGLTLTPAEFRGFTVFGGFGNCANCHAGVQLTDHSFRNNGLDLVPLDSGLSKVTHDPSDYGKFKVPSLRNIALTAPYMHDGRFARLDDVVEFYSSGVNGASPNADSVFQFFPTGFRLSFTAKTRSDSFSEDNDR